MWLRNNYLDLVAWGQRDVFLGEGVGRLGEKWGNNETKKKLFIPGCGAEGWAPRGLRQINMVPLIKSLVSSAYSAVHLNSSSTLLYCLSSSRVNPHGQGFILSVLSPLSPKSDLFFFSLSRVKNTLPQEYLQTTLSQVVCTFRRWCVVYEIIHVFVEYSTLVGESVLFYFQM